MRLYQLATLVVPVHKCPPIHQATTQWQIVPSLAHCALASQFPTSLKQIS